MASNQLKNDLSKKQEELTKLFEKMLFDILELDKFCDIEHLKETPLRMSKMLIQELLQGVYTSPDNLLKEFPVKTSSTQDFVIVRDIEIKSLCSHHFMPFYGTCDIVYLPNKKILGLSKFSRIADHFSRKPQVQENLTNEIADFIYEKVAPYAVGVKIIATHLCMKHRGAKSDGKMETFTIRCSSGKESLYNQIYDILYRRNNM